MSACLRSNALPAESTFKWFTVYYLYQILKNRLKSLLSTLLRFLRHRRSSNIPPNTSSCSAKKFIFTACHSGQLKLAFTSPDIISSTPKSFWRAELMSQFFCYSNCSKNITCPSGKLKTEFTSPVAKSTSPRLSDINFFARCIYMHIILLLLLLLLIL